MDFLKNNAKPKNCDIKVLHLKLQPKSPKEICTFPELDS